MSIENLEQIQQLTEVISVECFTIYSNDIVGRIDPYYYKPYFFNCFDELQKSKFKIEYLENVCTKVTDGTHFTPKYEASGVPFLSVKDVRENIIFFDDVKFISNEEHKNLIKRCKPEPGDILLTKVGTVGLASVIPKEAPDFSIFVSVALLKVDSEKVNPKYICGYLNSRFTAFQIDRALKGIGVPDLHLEDIKQILIPIPPIETQNKIARLIDEYLAIKVSKEQEIRELLVSIDTYINDELDINIPILDDKSIYTVSSEFLQNTRHDPYYYQPKFKEIENAIVKGKFETKSIGAVLSFNETLEDLSRYDQIRYIDLASIKKDTGSVNEISILNPAEAPSRARRKLEYGDLLVSGLGGSLQSIAIFDKHENDFIASTGFHIIKKSDNYNNLYLWALLRSSLFQLLLNREATGAIMPSISRDSLSDIRIPFPPLSIQNKISEEVRKRITKAEQLQNEAAEELERTKKQVEILIIEGYP